MRGWDLFWELTCLTPQGKFTAFNQRKHSSQGHVPRRSCPCTWQAVPVLEPRTQEVAVGTSWESRAQAHLDFGATVPRRCTFCSTVVLHHVHWDRTEAFQLRSHSSATAVWIHKQVSEM